MAVRPPAIIDTWNRYQVAIYLVAIATGLAIGWTLPESNGIAQLLVAPMLIILLYATFLSIPLTRIVDAWLDYRFLLLLLIVNFAVAPVVAFGVSRLVSGSPAITFGVLLVLLTPCIDYVVVFTERVGGDAKRLAAATPLLMLLQIVLLPLYLRLLTGDQLAWHIPAEPFLQAFAWFILLPFAMAFATQVAATRAQIPKRLQASGDRIMVPILAITLLAVICAQVPVLRDNASEVMRAVPVYLAFIIIMLAVGMTISRLSGQAVFAGRAVTMSGITRNSLVVLPLALSLPPALEIVGSIVVAQTVVELLAMALLIRLLPRLMPDVQRARADTC